MQTKFTLSLAAWFVPFSVSATAICAPPLTLCIWYAVHHGQPTFIGMALTEEQVSNQLQFGEQTVPVTVQEVTLQVEEAFEDTSGTTVDVYGSGTTNDFHFEVGTRYLVYGFRGKDGRIRTGKCARTAPVSEDGSFDGAADVSDAS